MLKNMTKSREFPFSWQWNRIIKNWIAAAVKLLHHVLKQSDNKNQNNLNMLFICIYHIDKL